MFWNTGGWTACVLLVVAIQALGVVIALTQWTAAPPALQEPIAGA